MERGISDFCRIFLLCMALFAAIFLWQPAVLSQSDGDVSQIERYAFVQGESCQVIATYAYFYSQPDFDSERLKAGDEYILLQHGEILQVEGVDGDFVLSSCEKGSGYIYQYYLSQSQSLTVYPVFNGSVRNDGAAIYDIDGQPTSFTAKAGQGVYIYNGFKDQGDFTSLQIVLEDGQLYNGLMKNVDIKPDGVSGLLIIGVSIIACCVTIILTIVFLKKKKKVK